MSMTKSKSCPECGGEIAPEFRPFCSKRCADVDLGRWLTGAYAIPASDVVDDGDDDDAADLKRH